MSVEDLLKALAENDRDREAPPTVEARLRSAFKRKYRRRTWVYLAAFAMAAAAAIVLFVNARPRPQTMDIAIFTPPVPVLPVAKLVYAKPVHRTPQPPKEIATDFYPLMDAPPPFERGELLRVSLPAAAMRRVGLPVSEDRMSELVQADILVGEEGLARAIRFVRFEH